ncbi:cytochrome c maturation protein CcmE [Cytophaga aurantiaca]|uniref:cytochrome c maturation protein CcmE domain-containing protein n=1 Tax=Cytophaga aurantiaca TaxID=29530 RepID=UPI00037E5DA9|nr:cytochrome c maturation protein CcmE [Cytophaga aurantiaca]
MKKGSIILLVIIAVAVAVIFSTTGSASQYVDFTQAAELAKEGDDELVHVIGKVQKNAAGEFTGIVYNPGVDPNYFEFLLTDTKNVTQKVLFFEPKPQDFEKAEQIVIIGHTNIKENVFIADKILMKCPSKYEDKEVKI